MDLARLKQLDSENCTGLTPEESAATINGMTTVRVVSRFASFRTLAAVLDDTEYATFKSTLATLAGSSQKIADMVEMLQQPGDSSGNGGGLDFGEPALRGMIDAYMPTMSAKLKSIGEVTVGVFEAVNPGNIEAARTF